MIARKPKRKRGGQPGNQNARKHGFYSGGLAAGQQAAFPAAIALKGVDREIAILRLKIASVLASDPQNYRLQIRALSSLGRLLRTRQKLVDCDRQQSKDLYRRFVSWLSAESESASK